MSWGFNKPNNTPKRKVSLIGFGIVPEQVPGKQATEAAEVPTEALQPDPELAQALAKPVVENEIEISDQ